MLEHSIKGQPRANIFPVELDSYRNLYSLYPQKKKEDWTKLIQTFFSLKKIATPFEKEIIIDFSLESIFNPLNKNLSCYTGDKFVTEDLDYQGIFDMEAYALAKVCKSFQLPFISFKYISDGANSDSSDDWTENISSGYKIFYQKVVNEILNYDSN